MKHSTTTTTPATEWDTLRAELGYRPSDEVAAELEARKAAWSQKRKAYEAALDQAHAEAQEEQARLDRAARTARVRRFGRLVADAVRSITNPAALVQAQQPEQPTEQPAVVETPAPAADPADLYTADEMPALADIERAALGYDLASDNARRADRAKRAARKVLDRLPAGTYGAWIVERATSNRQTADLDAIRATYKRLGLGPVPMKTNAPSLKVRRAAIVPADTEQLVEVAAR